MSSASPYKTSWRQVATRHSSTTCSRYPSTSATFFEQDVAAPESLRSVTALAGNDSDEVVTVITTPGTGVDIEGGFLFHRPGDSASFADSLALDPNGKIAAAIDNVYEASASMRDFTADLKEGHGMIGRIITDETYGNEILENIRQISSDLASITDKLNRGDGD